MNIFGELSSEQFDSWVEGYNLLIKAGVEPISFLSFEELEGRALSLVDYYLKYIDEGMILSSERGEFLIPMWLFRTLRKHVKAEDKDYIHSDTLIYEFRTGTWCRFSVDLDQER